MENQDVSVILRLNCNIIQANYVDLNSAINGQRIVHTFWFLLNGKVKGCALALFGFGPDAAAVDRDNALDSCQADACAGEIAH